MRTLAQGKSQKAILKLLRILINTSQSNFGDLNLDDECIRDIADVITAETPEGVVGSAALGDKSDGIELRPRGAVLTGSGSDNFYNELPGQGSKGAAAAQAREDEMYYDDEVDDDQEDEGQSAVESMEESKQPPKQQMKVRK